MTNSWSTSAGDWRTARITARYDGVMALQQLMAHVQRRPMMIMPVPVTIPEIPFTTHDIDNMTAIQVVMDETRTTGGTTATPTATATAAAAPHGEWIQCTRYPDPDDFPHSMSTLAITSSSSESNSDSDCSDCDSESSSESIRPTLTAYSDDTRIYPSTRLAPFGSHTFAYYDKLKYEAIQTVRIIHDHERTRTLDDLNKMYTT